MLGVDKIYRRYKYVKPKHRKTNFNRTKPPAEPDKDVVRQRVGKENLRSHNERNKSRSLY